MTATEITNVKAALTSLRNKFAPGPPTTPPPPQPPVPLRLFQLYVYLTKAISDVDGLQKSAGGLAEANNAGTFQVDNVCTVAQLPTVPLPALNDEAIVTDSTVATNGGTVVGGGAFRVLVRYDSINWIIV